MASEPQDARLANYRIERLLGSGGMGSVYLARDLALDRLVAIKFISPDKAADASARRRLIREAKAAAALDHPNICGVHEIIVEPDGRACIVMPYVEGPTLAETLKDGPLAVRFALSLTADIASALGAAHKHGIVHRDVKPQNVIITADRSAKLLDFGIARQPQVVAPDGETESSATTPGVIVGTPTYMSPEQALQSPLDGRSDLFSLGAVLYECLTGRRAFNGHTAVEIASQVLHFHPPAASTFRPELSTQHDELCRRLLAKDPDDRFRSAEELLGALRVLVPDSGRTPVNTVSPTASDARQRSTANRKPWALAMVGILAIAASIGVWKWQQARSNRPPSAAERFYAQGTDWVRDGAYHTGRLTLNKAIAVAPTYSAAYIRRAEAETALDEVDQANQTLLRVKDESSLSTDDRLRKQGVRGLMLRDADEAIDAYRQLTRRHGNDAGVWLDLGRAQDEFAMTGDARASFDRALQIDADYAAAHLRRASLLASEGQRQQALDEFALAESLYQSENKLEGVCEALLRRGSFLNVIGALSEARPTLERARDLAQQLNSRSQKIRADLHLSSVTASEGRLTAAQEMATAAVDDALREELETIAADGLIDLATTLIQRRQFAEAAEPLRRASDLAKKRGAHRILARAALQRASLDVADGRPLEGLELAREQLQFVRSNRYRRYELSALSIMSRAHESLGQIAEARALAEQALKIAFDIRDDAQAAVALENLAGQATATGALPDAIGFRREALEIHRQQKDDSILAFDLTNLAELLIRVGSHDEAERLLAEVDAGAAAGVDAYKGRARRVKSLRALSAAIRQMHTETLTLTRDLLDTPPERPDSAAQLAAALYDYAAAHSNQRRSQPAAALPGSLTTPVGREVRYWSIAALLTRGDAKAALAAVEEALGNKTATVSDEFQWRLAALGAAAATRMRADDKARALASQGRDALGRLRRDWKSGVDTYEARPDLRELQRSAGLAVRP